MCADRASSPNASMPLSSTAPMDAFPVAGPDCPFVSIRPTEKSRRGTERGHSGGSEFVCLWAIVADPPWEYSAETEFSHPARRYQWMSSVN
jgi:hypothetical protein